MTLSPNTQAILLLTAPLIVGSGESAGAVLAPDEYRRLARWLHETGRQPADLLAPVAPEWLAECQPALDSERLKRLLSRGFLLSQAVEHWQTRAIWVMSRADAEYPQRLKARLKENAPAVLYGCGDATILNTGGLAVVGSRHGSAALLAYSESIGRLAASARRTTVSTAARGVDQAAMRAALEAGGTVIGVLADSLEKASLNRDHRKPLLEGRLALVSSADPSAGPSAGNATQRNTLVYALADAALVVRAGPGEEDPWAGAVEQLGKRTSVPVYVRSTGDPGKGLEALRDKGALPWPNPETPAALAAVLLTTANGS